MKKHREYRNDHQYSPLHIHTSKLLEWSQPNGTEVESTVLLECTFDILEEFDLDGNIVDASKEYVSDISERPNKIFYLYIF